MDHTAIDRAIDLVLRIEEGLATVIGFEPLPNHLDPLCGELVDLYAVSSATTRDEMRRAGNPTQMRILVMFGQRVAILAVRRSDLPLVRRGILAQALEDFRWDPRENALTLTLLFDAAERVGGNPCSLVDEAVALASYDGAARLRAFAAAPASLASMGFREEMDAHGFMYARTW